MHVRGALIAVLLTACSSEPAPIELQPPGDWAGGPAVFSVTRQQAAEVVMVARFVDAFDAGRVNEAMALLGEEFGGSDCDYRHVAVVSFSGRQPTQDWLRPRAADHDRLDIREVYNLNPDQPGGVVGVQWARRSSDALRALRFREGIVPQLDAKVVFDRSDRIRSFANGPEGGSASICRTSVSIPSGAAPTPTVPDQFDLSPHTYEVGSRWISALKTLTAFEAAYAVGDLEASLALLADGVVITDCDYAAGQVVDAKGKEQAAQLLRAKFADHDRRQVGRIYNESGQPGVIGVVWASRAGDSLRATGFAAGIRQRLAAKVVLTENGGLIRTFANAGSGGRVKECRPTPAESL